MSSISCGGDAGDDVRHERVEHLGGGRPARRMPFEAFRPVQLDRAGAADGDIGHGRI
jgi:hypothetical protein